jgi:3-oxoacyl-[acyl-carrier-protein] synthase I
MNEQVLIVGLGASTAVGRDAWSSAAAVRAGVSGFAQHPYMIDSVGEAMRAALAPWIDIDVHGVDRFQALLFPAVDEALSAWGRASARSSRWAIALALPTARPGLPDALASTLTRRLQDKYGDVFGSAAAFSNGHAAGIIGLKAACEKLRSGALDACVVAAADSWMEPETLEWLEAGDQLHGAGVLNNAWGFIPGEAGAAVLLMRESVAHAAGLPALAFVLGIGTAIEPNRIKTETICTGDGLTQAFHAALAARPAGSKVTDIYCDMNGEPYRADEYGFACLRMKDCFASASEFIAPSDCWGDVGSCGSVLHLCVASIATHKGYAHGPLALVWASAEQGERAAALIAAGTGG